jgi:hypothetical protein
MANEIEAADDAELTLELACDLLALTEADNATVDAELALTAISDEVEASDDAELTLELACDLLALTEVDDTTVYA